MPYTIGVLSIGRKVVITHTPISNYYNTAIKKIIDNIIACALLPL